MSLPTSSSKPSQLSIRSFFQSNSGSGPKYVPPPSQATSKQQNGSQPSPPAASNGSATAPPPPPPSATPPNSNPTTTITALDAIQIPPLPPSLPSEASIRLVSEDDLNALRRINALLLPVSYPDHFYQGAADPTASGRFSRVITWQHQGEDKPKVVGGVVCRLQPPVDQPGAKTLPIGGGAREVPHGLYIQSLCLLSPYRSMGLVNIALENIIAGAVMAPDLDVKVVSAHAWTENEEGLKWYEGRGFRREGPAIKGYYLKLRPDSAFLLRRDIGGAPAAVRSALPPTSSSSSQASSQRNVPPSATASAVNLPPMGGPPRSAPPSRPPLSGNPSSGQSFQNQRPETEWNDLPEDMSPGLLSPPAKDGESGSAASSRSSSKARKKRDRAYPAAAFGT